MLTRRVSRHLYLRASYTNTSILLISGTTFASTESSMESSESSESLSKSSCGSIEPSPITTGARKGHRKSRLGCFNCKKRKIKCQENRPQCHHCVKAGLPCQYPVPGAAMALQYASLQTPQPPLSVTSTTFSLIDMHLFHHFLTRAYPHLPVGADHVWVNIIPAFAHHVWS